PYRVVALVPLRFQHRAVGRPSERQRCAFLRVVPAVAVVLRRAAEFLEPRNRHARQRQVVVPRHAWRDGGDDVAHDCTVPRCSPAVSTFTPSPTSATMSSCEATRTANPLATWRTACAWLVARTRRSVLP